LKEKGKEKVGTLLRERKVLRTLILVNSASGGGKERKKEGEKGTVPFPYFCTIKKEKKEKKKKGENEKGKRCKKSSIAPH